MESAYLRERICTYVLHEGPIPINPWMGGGYFLLRAHFASGAKSEGGSADGIDLDSQSGDLMEPVCSADRQGSC